VIGKSELNYVQFPHADAKNVMMQKGMDESVVDKLNEFAKLMNEGKILEDARRTLLLPHQQQQKNSHRFLNQCIIRLS